MTIIFSNPDIKLPNSGIFGPRFKVFCSKCNFTVSQIESIDFKYDNSFFKLRPKNTQIKHFWSQLYGIFVLDKTLH